MSVKQEALRVFLAANPKATLKEAAKACGCSTGSVQIVLKELGVTRKSKQFMWTPDRILMLRACMKKNMSAREIAEAWSVSRNSILYGIQTFSPLKNKGSKWTPEEEEILRASKNVEEASLLTGKSPGEVRIKSLTPGFAFKASWTPEEEERLLELKKEGLPRKEIAQRLNRSIHAVDVRYLNLSRKESKQ